MAISQLWLILYLDLRSRNQVRFDHWAINFISGGDCRSVLREQSMFQNCIIWFRILWVRVWENIQSPTFYNMILFKVHLTLGGAQTHKQKIETEPHIYIVWYILITKTSMKTRQTPYAKCTLFINRILFESEAHLYSISTI